MTDLWIANTISDLIEGDVREHLPLERIPLQGDVLGMGTTTSYDNGELAFLYDSDQKQSQVFKAKPEGGGVERLLPGEGLHHFPYACFSADATGLRHPLSSADLAELQVQPGEPLMAVVGRAIPLLIAEQRLEPAPVYGLRLVSRWSSLVYTVASKLCMGERRRNRAFTIANSQPTAEDGRSIYAALKHFRVGDANWDQAAGISNLGASPGWDCCGFWDSEPESGRLTVPVAGEHLHLHGCSQDLRHGGHLHHEHVGSILLGLDSLVIYPFHSISHLASDLAIESLGWTPANSGGRAPGLLEFELHNRGQLDVSDVGVAVVVDDHYNSHSYLRIPWLAAGEAENFKLPLDLGAGSHGVEVIADPHGDILEPTGQQVNNRGCLRIDI
ncbi:hypothetical protein KBY58_08085 [Cyanobium sp. HWJ4-Hawea]|nr:hypothetical protein [Cyanobium sp. HWJ4-Hawea]